MKQFLKFEKTDSEMFVHFTLLLYCISTGDLQPKTIFKIGSRTEHGIFSKKFQEITNLGIKYNFGLAKASEYVKESLGKTELEYNRFLVRLSQLINLGENLSEHLFLEVNSILQNYVANYHRNIESIKLMMGMFTAILSISSFMVGATSILNMMSGSSTGNIFVLTVSVSVLSLGVFVLCLFLIFPKNKIVSENPIQSKKLKRLTLVAIFSSVIICVIGFSVQEFPIIIAFAISGIPFLVPGYLARKLENHVKLLDYWYPVFLKDFGNIYHTVGTMSQTLSTLMRSDFSLISPHLRRMANHSKNRINNNLILELFSHDSNSHMIKSGNNILKYSLARGANLSKTGQTMNTVFSKIIELRKIRDQTSKSFFSMIVIMHVLSLFIFALITKVSTIFTNIFDKLEGFQAPFEFSPLEPELISSLLPTILLSFSLINSIAIKVGEGGYYKAILFYFGILMFSGGITLYASELIISQIILEQGANLDSLVGDEFKNRGNFDE